MIIAEFGEMNMSRHKNSLIVLVISTMIVLIYIFWQLSMIAGKFYFYQDLKTKGKSEQVEIIDKGISTKGVFQSRENRSPNSNYQFKLKIVLPDGKVSECQTAVSEKKFRFKKIGDKVTLTYLPNKPEFCRLTSAVNSVYNILLGQLILILMIVFLILICLIWILKLYKTPTQDFQKRLTTHLDYTMNLKCPKCHQEMEEGFIPGTAPIHWRKKDEPIGLTPVFAGLTGTTFLFRRPILHAYHCKNCEIITFKYGQKKKKA